MLKLIKFFKIH